MKIGLVCPYNMFQFAGGVQEIVFQLHKELTKNGHKVRIITPRPRHYDGNVMKDMIMVGRSVKTNTPFQTMVDFGFQADTKEIEEILDREQFDILHFHEPWVPLLSRQILLKSTAINIATFHATLPETVVSKSIANAVTPYTRSVLKNLDVLTAVSDSAAEFVRSLTKEKVHIIPNGVDLEHFKPKKQHGQSDKKTILYLGRLEKRKGVEYLLPAYALLRETHPNIRLQIAGSGIKRKMLEKYVEQYEIPDVEFLGFVDDKTKISLLREADVYCTPALYGESFGIVLLEAMATSTPIVAGNNSGYASVMKGRGKLSLVDPKNEQDFANRLELMMYDDDIRQLWRSWAHNEVKQYSFEHITEMYQTMYKQSLATHSYATK